jgi:transcriptional repressor NrdR
MRCPYCANTETKVVDKRDNKDEGNTRRRRECLSCFKRFTTYERIENVELHIIKKDGTAEQYNRIKLTKGVNKALSGSGIESEQINRMVDDIEMELLNMETTDIKSTEIGRLVLERLKKIDPVAYIRFASVYKDFHSLKQIKDELDSLVDEIGGS